MQWADPDTLSLIVSELATALVGSPVVLLASARPEMLVHSGGWGEGAVDHTRIDLRNLEPDDAEQMFKNLLARCTSIPDDIAQQAVEQTGGNPAFLEQLVRQCFENGTIDRSGGGPRVAARSGQGGRDRAADLDRRGDRGARSRRSRRTSASCSRRRAVFGNVFWVSAVIA